MRPAASSWWRGCVAALAILTLTHSLPALGAGFPAAANDPAVSVEGDGTSTMIPNRVLWPGVIVIVVIAIFVTAALAGPLIRANSRDEVTDSGDTSK